MDSSVKQINNSTLFIKRIDNVTVIADIDEETSVETRDESAEGNVTMPMAFRDIIVKDAVKLWVRIITDGSFNQTRLLVNTP